MHYDNLAAPWDRVVESAQQVRFFHFNFNFKLDLNCNLSVDRFDQGARINYGSLAQLNHVADKMCKWRN
jgi:L-rhamnose isomerase